MIPTIVEKQILSSLRTNKLKKQQTGKNLPPPLRCPPFFFYKQLRMRKRRSPHVDRRQQVSCHRKVLSCDRKLVSCDRKLVSCDRKLVNCDRKLVSCDRKLVSCDRKLSQVINLRSQVSKLRRKNRCVPYEPPYLAHVTPSNFFSRILKSEALVCD